MLKPVLLKNLFPKFSALYSILIIVILSLQFNINTIGQVSSSENQGINSGSLRDILSSNLHKCPDRECRIDALVQYKDKYSAELLQDSTAFNYFINEVDELCKDQDFNNSIADLQFFIAQVFSENGNYNVAVNRFNISEKAYEVCGNDSALGSVLYHIGRTYIKIDNHSSALHYLQIALEKFKAQNLDRQIAATLNSIGLVHYNSLNDSLAIQYYEEALQINSKMNDSLSMSISLFNIGNIYNEKDDYKGAIQYYLRSLQISELIADTIGVAYCNLNIGVLFLKQEDFEKSELYLKNSLEMFESMSDYQGAANVYSFLALLYINSKRYDEARPYVEKTLEISLSRRYLSISMDAYKSLSEICEKLGETVKALEYYKIYKMYEDSIFSTEKHLQLKEMESKYQSAEKQKEIELLNKDMQISDQELRKQTILRNSFIIGFILVLIAVIAILRSYLLKRKANIMLAQQKVEIEEKNEELHQQKEEIQSQAEFLEEINIELEKLSIVAKETINSIIITDEKGNLEWVNEGFTRLYGYSFDEFLSLVGSNLIKISRNSNVEDVIRACLKDRTPKTYVSENLKKGGDRVWTQTTLTPNVTRSSELKIVVIDTDISKVKEAEEEIRKQKTIIENKNKQIIDSITYAKLIQEAVLPSKDMLQDLFPESFVLFKPKDIVSGDFYWVTSTDNKVFFAVVDCTGHGVPGAFMSMIGNTLLNQIVNEKGVYEPSEILSLLNLGIYKALSAGKNGDSSQNDGMDISLCCFDRKTSVVKLSMANQNAVVVTGGKAKLIHGDMYSIGGAFVSRDAQFSDILIDYKSDTILYMFSDGYSDQFGGTENKKFMLSRLVELFENISQLEFEEQRKRLDDSIEHWKGDSKQIDDILIAGIRF